MTAPLRVRSFAKINLALQVLGRRADGFHEIRTVLQTIDLADELELRAANGLKLRTAGSAALESLPHEKNLVWRAASELAARHAPGRGADIVLHKRIPLGAGLGGGSSNAAAALLGLSRLWELGLGPEELSALAAGLGSDVPFFLEGGTALGVGRGEEIYALPDADAPPVVVVFPGVAVSTAEAYRALDLELTSQRNANRIQRFCSRLASRSGFLTEIFNDFESSILPAHAAILEAKSFLERSGATAALLCGSGSSVFGFFPEEESALAASRVAVRDSWRVFPAKTLSRAEYFHRMFE